MMPLMPFQSWSQWTAALLAVALLPCALPAQEPPPPPRDLPPPPPSLRPPDKPPGEGGKDRHDWRGRGGPDGDRHNGDRRGPPGKSMGGRPPMWGEGFEKLSEDEKRRVRDALGKAWGRPEVAAARDKLMAANEEMRRVINDAVKEIDPGVAKILHNMRGPEGFPGRGEPPRLPPVEAEEFPSAVVQRLEAELLLFSPPERREAARALHARLISQPAIGDAISRLRNARTGDRISAMEDLRKIYREAVSTELVKLRDDPNKPIPPSATKPDSPPAN